LYPVRIAGRLGFMNDTGSEMKRTIWFIILATIRIGLPGLAQDQQEVDYFVVMLEGKKVGHAIQTRSVADGRVTTTERVHVSINRVGVPVSMEMTEIAIETTDGKPIGFESIQQLSAMKITVKGKIRPDGKLDVTTESMGARQNTQTDWPAGALMAEGLRLLGIRQGLEPGTTYKTSIFVPSLLQAVAAEVAVGPRKKVELFGQTVELTEVKTTLEVAGTGQMTTTSYVDKDYRSHKTVMPMAGMLFEMLRCSEEVATSPLDPVELLGRMFIPSPVQIDNAAKAGPIVYTLRPVQQGAALPIPVTDTQTVRRLEDGAIELTVRPIRPAGGSLPYDGNDPTLLAALRPNTFLQSKDGLIIDLARKAIADANDAATALMRIEEFVGNYIQDKALSIGYASAAEVAQTRQGDCTEHAVLAAAMCRAVGIPARVVTGIAYVDQFSGQTNVFGGHAWVSAYVGGKWVCIDPAFKGTGRGGYDAGHIALAVGDGQPADFFNLAVLLGQFTIQKIQLPQTVTSDRP